MKQWWLSSLTLPQWHKDSIVKKIMWWKITFACPWQISNIHIYIYVYIYTMIRTICMRQSVVCIALYHINMLNVEIASMGDISYIYIYISVTKFLLNFWFQWDILYFYGVNVKWRNYTIRCEVNYRWPRGNNACYLGLSNSLSWQSCWANIQVSSDLRHLNAHVMSLWNGRHN